MNGPGLGRSGPYWGPWMLGTQHTLGHHNTSPSCVQEGLTLVSITEQNWEIHVCLCYRLLTCSLQNAAVVWCEDLCMDHPPIWPGDHFWGRQARACITRQFQKGLINDWIYQWTIYLTSCGSPICTWKQGLLFQIWPTTSVKKTYLTS